MSPEYVEASLTLDRDGLMSHVDSDIAILGELVSLFRDYYPTEIENIRGAVRNSDRDQLQLTTRLLKGAVGNFYAPHASKLAIELESAARDERFGEVDTLVRKLDSEVDRMFVALGKICQN